eukprot:TRINITY_DN4808_c0_g1_i3.p2 TRINITY_DN4808_c0_g1~~TRINITY_DN4808_c0_g1_i3.p2  ORF type:complete len:174 (-),score=24.45 TRINITY_DN4808_c0_g1_i3:678-1199(-)
MAAIQRVMSEELIKVSRVVSNISAASASTAFSEAFEASSSRCSDDADSLPTTPRSTPDLPVRYPADLVIRNTFIDFTADSALVLQQRRTRSLEPKRTDFHKEQTGISNVGVGGVASSLAFKVPQTTQTASEAEPRLNIPPPSVGSRDHGTGKCTATESIPGQGLSMAAGVFST